MLEDRFSRGLEKGGIVLADTAGAFGFFSCCLISALCDGLLEGRKGPPFAWLFWGGALASYLLLARCNIVSKSGE